MRFVTNRAGLHDSYATLENTGLHYQCKSVALLGKAAKPAKRRLRLLYLRLQVVLLEGSNNKPKCPLRLYLSLSLPLHLLLPAGSNFLD